MSWSKLEKLSRLIDPVTGVLLSMAVLANVLILVHVQIRWVLPVLGLVLALGLPTRLVSRVLVGHLTGPGTRTAVSLSLVLLALMVAGLLVNEVLPLLGDDHPLRQIPVLCLVDLVSVAVIATRPDCLRPFPFRRSGLRAEEWFAIGGAALAVGLSASGAVRLNNGAGAEVTIAALLVCCAVSVHLLRRCGELRPAVVLGCLYGLALAVLWMTSLRGWYTTGHDIQLEFRTFLLVQTHSRWSLTTANSSYSACLSITILPQLLWQVTRVALPYVYKVDFPLMFAICPVVVCEISRRILGWRLAIAAALLFICFPTFVNDMVFINRQEVAFLFVAAILAVISSGRRAVRHRQLLLAALMAGMVVSHYSTDYVFVATLAIGTGLAWVTDLGGAVLARMRWHQRKGLLSRRVTHTVMTQRRRAVAFRWPLLVFLIAVTGGWTVVAAHASSGFTTNLSSTFDAFIGTGAGGRSSDVNYSVLSQAGISTPAAQLDAYRRQVEHQVGPDPVAAGYYPTAVLDHFATSPGPTLRSVPNALGHLLSTVGLSAGSLNSAFRSVIARLLQILSAVGVVAAFVGWRRSGRLTPEHALLAFASLIILGLDVILPVLSVNYGILRMFQQALLLLAPIIVIGMLWVLAPLGRRGSVRVACVVTLVFFVSLTGLLPQLTGGYDPQLNLNNAGEYYENYYTQPQEVAAIEWLNTVAVRDSLVQTDPYTAARLSPYTSIKFDPNDFPNLVYRDSFVILGANTVSRGVSTFGTNDDMVDYRYPVSFLGKVKNLVYASNGAEIFVSS